jgi:hypothetical protein
LKFFEGGHFLESSPKRVLDKSQFRKLFLYINVGIDF